MPFLKYERSYIYKNCVFIKLVSVFLYVLFIFFSIRAYAYDITIEDRGGLGGTHKEAIEISDNKKTDKHSLIEMTNKTQPCEGCYFAVFDKVKNDYKLTYITPNTPNMADIVKSKQEVLWVDANGNYSPYWNWGRETSFKFGFCASGVGAETKYECASNFWSNTVINDAVTTLGIYTHRP